MTENVARLTVKGRLQVRGIGVDKTVDILATFVPGGATKRGAGKGDLLVLRSRFALDRTEFRLQMGIGIMRAGGGQEGGTIRCARHLETAQRLARVAPMGLHALRLQVRGTKGGGHQFSQRQDLSLHTMADLANQPDTGIGVG